MARIVITSGPTRQYLDPVRYLSNNSSGKMGYALAEAARVAGADVILITGPSALTPPEGVLLKRVKTAAEMHQSVMDALKPGCIFIGAAAVSDYAIDAPSETKIKKQASHKLALELKQNPDILAAVALSNQARFVMGFAAETDNLITHARDKLNKKKLDCIVANWVGEGVGFDVDHHEVTVLTHTQKHTLSKKHKVRLAGELVAIIAVSLQNSGNLIPELTYEPSYSS